MLPRAIVVLNRAAGRRADVRRERIERTLSTRYRLEILEGRGAALRRTLAQAMGSPPDLIVSAGGDGTVSSCAAAARASGVALAIVPGGTANSIARALGIPTDLDLACQLALEANVREIDVADVHLARPRPRSRSMLLMATLGLHADTIALTSRSAKRRFGPLAYLASAVDRLTSLAPFDVELETEAQRMQCRLTAITIANLAPPYSVWAQGPAELEDDDGKLDVTLVSADSAPEVVAAGVHLFRSATAGEPARREDVGFFRCERVRITTDPPQRLMVDGDDAGTSPVEISCDARCLRVIAPRIA